jgi:hypothetical protein
VRRGPTHSYGGIPGAGYLGARMVLALTMTHDDHRALARLATHSASHAAAEQLAAAARATGSPRRPHQLGARRPSLVGPCPRAHARYQQPSVQHLQDLSSTPPVSTHTSQPVPPARTPTVGDITPSTEAYLWTDSPASRGPSFPSPCRGTGRLVPPQCPYPIRLAAAPLPCCRLWVCPTETRREPC